MQEVQLTKYQTSESVVINRQQLLNAPYNPRKITESAQKELKKNLKRVGLLGGIIVNKRTMNIVSGHQRLTALDSLEKTQDYNIRVDMIDVDEKTEMEQNIFMNNATVQGEFDLDMMRNMIPMIDYELAGLDKFDLNQIGVTIPDIIQEGIDDISEQLDLVTQPVQQQKQQQAEAKKQHVKDVKAQVNENTAEKVNSMDAFVTLSFDSLENKIEFMERFGLNPNDRFVKGEVFGEMIEAIM